MEARRRNKMKEESKSVKLRGWDAVLATGGVLFSYAATALLMSWPIAWLINHAFAPGIVRAVFGGDRLSYWQCVTVFAIWYCARVKVRFPFTVHGKF
jgi:hypothetical protein